MRGWWVGFAALCLFAIAPTASAHVGSPDVFFDGQAGPYSARVVVRMPPVVPGRAQIEVKLTSADAAEVSFRPLYARTSVKNAPPPEAGLSIPGEPGLYRGELWLMSFGAYGIEIHVNGQKGEGTVQVPVNSAATHQLPLPGYLGIPLAALGVLLIGGGLGVVGAAAGQSALAPGEPMDARHRRKSVKAIGIAAVVFCSALVGGRFWWMGEEGKFRERLREGPWPDLTVSSRSAGDARVLDLTIGETAFARNYGLPLALDHGKELHLFLVREPERDVFAHLHPHRRAGKNFEVTLPPLPAGRYRAFCDLTLADTGVSATASTAFDLPAAASGGAEGDKAPATDPDDSWAAVAPTANSPMVCVSENGDRITWKAHLPLRIKQDAQLDFAVTDRDGHPIALQPYMGMLCHAAVLRSDDTVFAHLHPTGNFSMAAQAYFAAKIGRETAPEGSNAAPAEMDHSKMGHAMSPTTEVSTVTLPYEFPAPGNYRIWAQCNAGGRILTGVFDAKVEP